MTLHSLDAIIQTLKATLPELRDRYGVLGYLAPMCAANKHLTVTLIYSLSLIIAP
jgi:hypothetical protein